MKKSKLGLLRRFIPYYKKYKWILFLDLFCAALTTVCEIVLPLIVGKITSYVEENIGVSADRHLSFDSGVRHDRIFYI